MRLFTWPNGQISNAEATNIAAGQPFDLDLSTPLTVILMAATPGTGTRIGGTPGASARLDVTGVGAGE